MWQLIQRTCWTTLNNGTALPNCKTKALFYRHNATKRFFLLLKSCKIIYPGIWDAHSRFIISVETQKYLNKTIYNTSFSKQTGIPVNHLENSIILSDICVVPPTKQTTRTYISVNSLGVGILKYCCKRFCRSISRFNVVFMLLLLKMINSKLELCVI